jgi:alpha-glucosidase
MRFGGGAYPHERYHNQYALLMAMGTTDGLRRVMPDKRTFVLSRAGSAGIQRYAANWMGDNCSRWDHLWMSMPMGAGLGVSGQPFVGADVGGFRGSTNAELLVRWMQYGALTPFCRNHSEIGNLDQYAWAFGGVVEELCRQALGLRYRLMPYLYTAFMRSTETGEPVQQPLVFAYQHDRTVRDIDDAYLLGSDLLVAPIFSPEATARHVYLPAGTWYRWQTDERSIGGRFYVAQAPMDSIPLYARGGAIIPLWPEVPPSTAGYHPRVIELHAFVPAEDGVHVSLLHEDDGLTFAFQAGAYYRTALTLERRAGRLTIAAEVSGDGYPEFARGGFELVLHGASPAAVIVDGEEREVRGSRVALATAAGGFRVEAQVG